MTYLTIASVEEISSSTDRYTIPMDKVELVDLIADLAGKVKKSGHDVVFDEIVSLINKDVWRCSSCSLAPLRSVRRGSYFQILRLFEIGTRDGVAAVHSVNCKVARTVI